MKLKKAVRLLIALKQINELIESSNEDLKRVRRMWMNPFLEKRELHNLEAHLLKDILWEEKEYQNFCRLKIDDFEKILNLVNFKIKKKDTVMRCAISPRIRLAITLRYLASGDSFRSLEFLSHVSRKTISQFVPEVLNAIVECLQSKYLVFPSNENEWLQVANEFNRLWQFPHTLGAMDGKHIRIKAPPHSGSDFFNYKGFFSTVLFAVVDANGKFLYIDIGGNGRASDVVILKNSSLYSALKEEMLKIPPDEFLKGQNVKTPYFFIGDDIFGLERHIMKAYNRNSRLSTSEEIFNYRLSRARMPVEMAFGRLSSRFRIFHRPIEVNIETCDLLVKTCCILHNYLTTDMVEPYLNETLSANLPETILPLPPQSHDTIRFANEARDNVRKYLVTDGDVPFQWNKIKKQTANPVTVTIN
ncbi:putative nuclease HARBI1 [Lucilia cuprina]|nr:putative nuclease HARBI1 [Lucilia cuprina]